MNSVIVRPEQPPVRRGPDAGSQRFHRAAARDHEAEAPGLARHAAPGEGAEHLGERAGIGAVGALADLDVDGQRAVRGMKDEIDLAAGVGAEEVERRRLRLPGGPAQDLVEDRRLEESALPRALLVGQVALQVCPAEVAQLRAPVLAAIGSRAG